MACDLGSQTITLNQELRATHHCTALAHTWFGVKPQIEYRTPAAPCFEAKSLKTLWLQGLIPY